VNFRNYDFVVILAAGKVWPHALCDYDITTNYGGRLRGFVVNEQTGFGTWAHELGHVLASNVASRGECGLPDMYSYEAEEKGKTKAHGSVLGISWT